MTLLQFLNQCPPIACRLLARKAHGRRALTVLEIAIRSGLSPSRVAEIAKKRTWSGVRVQNVQAFAAACGVNFFNLKQHRRFLKSGDLYHIRRLRGFRAKHYRQLLGIAEGSLDSVGHGA